MAKKKNEKDILKLLRTEAEHLLSGKWQNQKEELLSELEIKKLLHELQVHQVELEMQNDELRISQQLLEKERLRFTSLFNMAPVGYFILNKLAVIEECNDMALSMLAARKQQVIDKRFLNFIVPEQVDLFYGFIRNITITRQSHTCLVNLRSAHGSQFPVQIEGKSIEDPNTAASFFYLGVVDVSEKRAYELKQREIKDQLQMALRASSAGTWRMQLSPPHIVLDEFASALFGFDGNGYNDKYDAFFEFIHPEDRGITDQAIQRAILKNTDLSVTFRIVLYDGSIRCIEALGHLEGEENKQSFFVGVMVDVTEKHRLADEAHNLRMNHQKSVLRAIVDTQEDERIRISTALHDSVGQLLYAISLNIDKSASDDLFLKKAHKLLHRAILETRNISFELAPSVLTDFGLAVALNEMVKRISSSDLTFIIQISGILRLQPKSEIFIFRIVQELSNNILKHARASQAHIVLKREGDDIIITVKDNGIGFYTKEEMTNSTGLYSIKNRLTLYSGNLKINSKKNKGTTITITLHDIADNG